MKEFPIVKAGYIFNPMEIKKQVILKLMEVDISYPCRLDAMAINPAAVCYNDSMVFTPGEVVVSLKQFINVKIKVVDDNKGKLVISDNSKRKVLIKHSYLLMCSALKVSPSLEIDVCENIPKHCGFGSSSSTICAVASAINELYGNPIKSEDLIKYLAGNHGEEVTDADEDNLKVVQCIGGGATNGLTEEGIIIIAGRSTAIAKMKYEGKVIIGIPGDFVQKDAKELMELEEKNLWKFKKTGEEYANVIAYDLLHKVLPDMVNGSIKELANVVFNYRFNMGSNANCSFVYDGLTKLGEDLRCLFENGDCEFLALSSVGPAYFVIVSNENQKNKCLERMHELKMNTMESSICNTKYIVNSKEENKCFWESEETNKSFQNRPPSKYITDEIDKIDIENKNCIDIGCGGGRYSKYLISKNARVLSVDKYPEMIGDVNKYGINFIQSCMDNIPVKNDSYDLVLSIGVIHNSVTEEEYEESLKEIYRILNKKGNVILSTFTNDVISGDLVKNGEYLYSIINRPPMVLYSKERIEELLRDIGFKNIELVEEHVTDVGSGERDVCTYKFGK